MNRSDLTSGAVKALAAHPYLLMLSGIMLITPLSFGHTVFVNNAAWFGSLLFIAVLWAVLRHLVLRRGCEKAFAVMIAVSSVCFYIAFVALYGRSESKVVWHFAGGAVTLLLLRFALRGEKRWRTQLNALFIMGLGFIMKLCYVLNTSMYTRQNDVGSFENGYGHAGYIMYLIENMRLPDFDPRSRWQFCHPPLHHIISAVWMRTNSVLLMTGENPARESLQMLSLFYSMCIMITAYRILRHFKLKGAALYVPLIIINLHPAFLLLSGSVNNDVLSVAFIMGAVMLTLRWAESRDMRTILKLALCIGLGMMTKISAAIVAPPVALVFLIVLIKHRKDESSKIIKQLFCFGLVCVPLGMWFPLWQYFRWGIPFTYVHEMSVDSFQYVGDMPFTERITDFSLGQLDPIYEHWRKVDENGIFDIAESSEHNPLIALLKNSIFGETFGSGTFADTPFVYSILPVFFGLNVLLAAAAFVSMIWFTANKCRAIPTEKAFLCGFYAFMLASFYRTAADYPFTCTMNFRYITPTAIIGALYIGFTLDSVNSPPQPKPETDPKAKSKTKPKPKANTRKHRTVTAVNAVFWALSVCFALCTTIVYLAL